MQQNFEWEVMTSVAATAEKNRSGVLETLGGERSVVVQVIRAAARRATLLAGFMQTSSSERAEALDLLPPGEKIGVWRVEEVLGAGGMGAVYRVHRDDGELAQRGALKVMHADDPGARERFGREREVLASLEHHGINRIIDGGSTEDGRPYMVVELVGGQPIDTYVQARSLPPRAVLELVIQLCSALGYAHRQLILHRDIKASNVLVDESGRVRLIDFGVASLLDTEGERAGPLTIAYAAPEMLSAARLTVAADIFSAGMLAVELLTGSLPARDSEGGARISASAGDRDLVAVLSKATAASPEERYASSTAFSEDLTAWIEERPVGAREGGPAYRAGKLFRRNPVGTALAAALCLSLVGGLVGTSLMARRAAAEATRARAALAEARFALAKAERNFRVQEAYGDALHRAFGGEGNAQRMTEVLLRRAREAHQRRHQDPIRAAEIIFALGRNFVERNDYKTAAELLEPWVEEGFGDPQLLVLGRLNLALALRLQGEVQRAQSLFGEVASHFAGSPDEGSYDHLVALVHSAGLSRGEGLRREVTARLTRALEKGGTVEERAFYLNSLSQMKKLAGDYRGAEAATIAVHELLTANPLVEIAGREAILVNKAMYATFVSQDHDTARSDIDTLLHQLTAEKGESSLLAYAYELSSALALNRGELPAAVADGERAAAVAERLSGPGSAFHLGTSSALVEALVAAQRYEEAGALLDALKPLVAQTHRGRDTRFALARAYFLVHTQGPAAASAWLRKNDVTRKLAARTPLYQFRLERLEGLGVEAAPASL